MKLVRDSDLAELSEYLRQVGAGGSAEPLDVRNQREGALSLLRSDIHKCMERLQEHSAALEHEREDMSQALADISLQLKTPLTSLLMIVDLLDDPGLPAEKRAAFVADMRTALTRMQWLVAALLTFARLDAGSIEFKRKPVPLRELVAAAVHDVAIMLEVRGQELEVHGPRGGGGSDGDDYAADGGGDYAAADGEPMVVCDRRWTCEALTNIIKNASEHTPDGGIIVVSYGTNPLAAWIAVTDSGPGIASEQIPRLFRRFAQGNKQGGTGIGLPLALSIAKAQKGDIEVNSTPQGATFTLKLYK
jgi:signal transduction histidine kinase